MRYRPVVCSLLLLMLGCGDSGSATATESGSQTDVSISDSTAPSGGTTATASGTASESGGPATGPDPTGGPPTGMATDSGASSDTTAATSTTSTTDASSGTTGDGFFCSPTDVPVEDVLLNDACDIPLQMGSFTPVVEWKWGTFGFCGPAVAGQAIDSNMSGQLDFGDLPLVFLYQVGAVVALWGDGSGVAWQKPGNYGSQGSLALGDLEGDGWLEIITAKTDTICALDARDGAQKWCTGGLGASMDGDGWSYPSIADMDGDGSAEVVIGNAILDSTGALIGTGNAGKGALPWLGNPNQPYGALSAVVDLDVDGVQEVVTGNAAYDIDGLTVWQNGGLDGFVAVADFDGDGQGEIVKTSGLHVFGMETDGNEVWGPVTYRGHIGPPAIDDLDGDGVPEIVFGAETQLVAMEWGGQVMWTAPISDITGAAGPILFDFEADGYPEVLYADEQAIRFFSGLDGSLKFTSMEHASATIYETPIVADVDGDDQVEIVLGHCNANPQIGAITIYGDQDKTWPPGRKVWNQHTYHITNVNNLGGIPDDYQSNWSGANSYNNFRSGDIGQQPGEYHDLQPEILGVCEDQCEQGTFYMTARIRNAGNVEVPAGIPVTVRAGLGGPIVVTLESSQPVPPGKTGEILFFEFEAKKLAQSQPVITVDDTGFGDGELFECDELNNTAVWPEEVCPTVIPG